jgi:hypothetical protein
VTPTSSCVRVCVCLWFVRVYNTRTHIHGQYVGTGRRPRGRELTEKGKGKKGG